METEIKLAATPETIESLKRLPVLEHLGKGPPQTRSQRSVYFDTGKLAVYASGLSLRVRHDDNHRLQTVKALDDGSSVPFEREEWERPIESDRPKRAAAKGSALERLLSRRKKRRRLQPVFETLVERTIYQVGDAQWEAEIALDQGELHVGQNSVPLCEVELELKKGDPARLFDLARTLSQTASLHLAVESKAERGYALLRNAPPTAIKAKMPKLRRGMAMAEAFQTIGLACLGHLMRNHSLLSQSGDAEALHQMRVALRRLRSAISLFKPVLADEGSKRINSELKALTNTFSAARDSDQFLATMVGPLFHQRPDEEGLPEFVEYWEGKRKAAFDAARAAINSRQFDDLVLVTEEWILTGPWLASQDEAVRALLDQPVEKYATHVLGTRRRKLIKRGQHMERLDPAARHKLRIQAKKLRYAAEFFSCLWTGSTASRRCDRLLDALKRMQDSLGALHDIMVANQSAQAEFLDHPPAGFHGDALTRLSFAAGLVLGHQFCREEPLLKGAMLAFDDFAAITGFWK